MKNVKKKKLWIVASWYNEKCKKEEIMDSS